MSVVSDKSSLVETRHQLLRGLVVCCWVLGADWKLPLCSIHPSLRMHSLCAGELSSLCFAFPNQSMAGTSKHIPWYGAHHRSPSSTPVSTQWTYMHPWGMFSTSMWATWSAHIGHVWPCTRWTTMCLFHRWLQSADFLLENAPIATWAPATPRKDKHLLLLKQYLNSFSHCRYVCLFINPKSKCGFANPITIWASCHNQYPLLWPTQLYKNRHWAKKTF